MNTDLDILEEALGYFARAMSRAKSWEAIQRTAKTTIDRPSAHLLMALCDSPSGCRLHELAAKIGIEAPSITRTVQRLEQDKLITRTIDQADRRAIYVRPTPQGLRTVEHVRLAKRERLKALLGSWSTKDREQLVRLVHRLAREAARAADLPVTAPAVTSGGAL
jgi:DNA-binding MarR family transcriptional regulator